MDHKLKGAIISQPLFTIVIWICVGVLPQYVLASHWINLNVWHDELTAWDEEQSMSNNVTAITGPGGSRRPSSSSLPGCHELDGLTDGQIKLCLLFYDHMRPVIQGAKMGISECRFQLRHYHWNCTVPPLDKPVQTDPPYTLLAATTTTSNPPFAGASQSRVLRANRNMPRKRQARNHKNSTENLHIGRDLAYMTETSSKSKKKNRKNLSTIIIDETGTNNNSVMGGGTASEKNIHDSHSNLYHYEKEEKGNWNSILMRGTKEVAFVQALWSASVTEAVARSCREGAITSCGCGKTQRPADLKDEWRWGGCSDNLQYGYKFAQSFVDIKEQENSPADKKAKARSLVNLHNNEAGRRAVLKKTKIACKCHGVSGSCALVTCWHQIPSFREIGDFLKLQYEGATQVKINRRGKLQVKRSGVPVPSVVDLVYLDPSPNYCVKNETLGVFGTTGRVCNHTSPTAPNSCKNLCCNRGYTTVLQKKTSRCNCSFKWCCNVVCKECHSVQKEVRCL